MFPSVWALLCLGIVLVRGDTHESLAKKTSKGYPYYLKTSPIDTLDIYDTTVPVVFEFKTPNWTKPISLIDYTCTGDNYEVDGYSCPVLFYWLTQVRDILQEDIFVDNLKAPDSSSFYNSLYNCNGINDIFEGLYLNDSVRLEFYNFLSTNCQSDRTIRLPLSSKYTAENIDAPYKKMREKFFEDYYSLQTPLNRSNDAMYTNARYNFYSSGLFNYYVEAQRWKDALNLCKSKFIPNTLIPPSDLNAVLSQIQDNYARPNGLTLTIPAANISSYYKSSYDLADCAFTSDSLIVVVHVPLSTVSISEKKSNFAEFITVPYFRDPEVICYINEQNDPGRLIVNADSSEILGKENDLSCHGDKRLCQLPTKASSRKSAWPPVRFCLQGLFEDDDDTACDVSCKDKGFFELPMAKQISSDRVLIVGDPNAIDNRSEVKVVCPLYQKEEVVEFPVSGSLEITLPCGCLITNRRDRVLFKAESPCASELHKVAIHLGGSRTNVNSSSLSF